MTDNKFYTINGAFLIFLFLASRVMFVPITVTIYAAQYHHWDLLQALGNMKVICHICNALQFCFQTYWFVLLVRLARSVVRGWFQSAGEVRRSTTEDKSRTSMQHAQFHVKKE